MVKFKKLYIIFIMATFIDTFLYAMPSSENQAYLNYMNSVSKVENKMKSCVLNPDQAPDCYNHAEETYKNIIKDVRNKYKQNINPDLWQSINLNYAKIADTCKSPTLSAGTTQTYYPFADCSLISLHGLVITTIELHLKSKS